MSDQIKQDMHDLALYDDLIKALITLKVILEDIDKISIAIGLEINNKIKQLEAEKLDELELFEDELRLMTLKNRFLARPNKIKKYTEEDKQKRRYII